MVRLILTPGPAEAGTPTELRIGLRWSPGLSRSPMARFFHSRTG